MSRIWVWAIVLALVGIAAGVGLGLWYGWEIDPVEYTDTDIAYLHPIYRDEYMRLVSSAYALDGDLNTARARLVLLDVPDPAVAVADLAERAIADGVSAPDIALLARLAVDLGADRAALEPYVAQGEGQ